MTRLQLEQAVFREFGYADSPATAVSNRIRQYLNTRHRMLLTAPGREKLRREVMTFSTVASQATYGAIGPDLAQIERVVDTTNNIVLVERSLDWYRWVDPSPQSGTSEYYIVLRQGPALRDISASAGSGIWVVSTAAGDAQTVEVETLDTNGSVTNTTATINGTTRVQIGTATNHLRLTKMAISAAATGVIELYDAATGGNLVARIGLDRTNAQRSVIALWPTPSAVVTIQVDFIHHIRDFSQNYDEPQLPLDFHYLVALGGKIDEARHRAGGKALPTAWESDYAQGNKQLDAWIINTPGYIVVPGTASQPRRSNLGPAYPAGVW